MRAWDDFDADARDASGSDETTRETERAHEWAIETVADMIDADPEGDGSGYRWAQGGSRLRVLLPWGYVAEVRGQNAGPAHGKQGAHPQHLAELREIEVPVLLVFLDGRSVQSGWLHLLPDPENISLDPARRRVGWLVRDLEKTAADEFVFPVGVPERSDDQGRLVA